MASQITKSTAGSSQQVKFLSVTIDGKNEEAVELKDMLKVEGVPTGIIHAASEDIFGQKVNLNRKNLTQLKKKLERFVTNEMGADMFLYELKSQEAVLK